MHTLIVYYSFTHNNEKLANTLKGKLKCDMVKLETVKKRHALSILLDLMFGRTPALKPVSCYLLDYDHIIFVAPIWAGKIAMPLKTFLRQEKVNIGHYSFVTICGGGNTSQKDKVKEELLDVVGKSPDKVVELWINDILPEEHKGTIKYTSGYRIAPHEFDQFPRQIDAIINGLN